MSESIQKPSLKKLGGSRRRRAVSVSSQELVETGLLATGQELPLVIRPAVPGVDLAAWAESHRERLTRDLEKHGGILFRGFDIPDVDVFQETVRAISGDLLEYKERSSPRHEVSGKVYTSTDYPPDQPIFLHNENSYQQVWPMRLFFFCNVEPGSGGETPIADVRKVHDKVPEEIRQRFADKKWTYVRNFGSGLGLDWQTVFQTDDREVVEEYCKTRGIELEWKEGGRLRTRATRPAASRHPETGDDVWFNHATFFHVSTLTPAIREALLSQFASEDLPANTYYGDGTEIEPETLETLRSIYREETIKFPWQKGDLLMLDNMLVAHGREPFAGQRQILVGMADPCSWDQLDT